MVKTGLNISIIIDDITIANLVDKKQILRK